MRNEEVGLEQKGFLELERNEEGEVISVRSWNAQTASRAQESVMRAIEKAPTKVADSGTFATASPRSIPKLDRFVEELEDDGMFATASRQRPVSFPPIGHPNRSKAIIATVFGIGLAAGALIFRTHGESNSSIVAAAHGIDAPQAKTAVRISLRADPPSAHFQIDDGPVLPNPFTGTLPRDAEAHRLTTFAEGYETSKEPLSFDADGNVVLALKKTPEPTRPNR